MRALRSIVITGASSGLGKALALHYAAPGVELHLLGRDMQRLQETISLCEAKGASVHFACIDVLDREAMQQWLTHRDEATPVDMVIANAGISAGTGGIFESEEQARRIFDVNVTGVMNTLWPLIPAMEARRQGQVVMIGSLAGCFPLPGAPAYSASKAAIRYYGEALRAQLAESGVRVLMVYPGFIDTPMTRVNPFPMPFLMHADTAAKRIADAVACGKPRIFFPFAMGFAVRALHFMPRAWANKWFMSIPSKPQIS